MTAAGAGSGFRARYEAAAARNHSLLCVGLDPDPARMPAGVDRVGFLRSIIEATSDLGLLLQAERSVLRGRWEGGAWRRCGR